MAVKYLPIDGELVSQEWHVALIKMRAAGVSFVVREGHRTMARQWYFWNGYRKRIPGFNLAAFPSPFAPHIRTGRIDHAIDFGNDASVFKWLGNAGLHPSRTVRGESWHIEVSAANLKKYAAKHGAGSDKTLRYGMKGPSVVKLKKLLYDRGHRNFSGKSSSNRYNPFFGKFTRGVVIDFQKKNNLTADGVVGPSTWRKLRRK